ncbi:phosphatidylinositol 3,4,5-trisphosphate 3-phosphatase TPTE2 isoform X1 [Symphalangus syndactylus]|uniref:phosphatidylinositol 3,4,5-trisphosphate 3-phosphatase TPTE2 isoform X1 n=2 Tax=Symphalangus syndactylus TaxID=9590 RepID=UPI0030040FB2
MCRVMKASFTRKVNFELCLLSDCILLSSSSPPTNELSGVNPKARMNESPHPDELTAVIIDGGGIKDIPQTNEFKGATEEAPGKESPHPDELTAVIIDGGGIKDIPQTNEFKGAIEEAPGKEIPHTSEFKGAALVSPISESMLERLSKFEVEDAENVASYEWTHLVRLLRLIILIRIFHLAHQKRQLEKLMRRLVSENKSRYTRGGFDLDLTYITERIIAMSFPSSGRQSFYRNPIEEVVRFLDKKHPNHYRVYNLCSERAYDPKHFHNRVGRIMIDDHNVPTLHEMVVFTKEVKEWMAQDLENIVVIHCNGGKGRTGTMVCAFLIASEIFLTAEESLYYFGERRTDKTHSSKFQGVETPSQNRYVGYFAQVKHLYNWNLPPRRILFIKRFIIYSFCGDVCDLKFQIVMEKKVVFSSTSLGNCSILHDIETAGILINVYDSPPLYDDVKVQFFSSNLPKYYDNCSFFFWFNTSFIQNNRLYLPRNELDNPHKQKAWKIYLPEFAVEILFGEK